MSIRNTIQRVKGELVHNIAPDELYVNGKTLTSLFGVGTYKQLTVTGRGLKSFTTSTTGYLNRSGARLNSIKVEPLDFEIKYMLLTRDSGELRMVLDTLQEALNGVSKISFADDMEYEYRDVVLSGVGREPEHSYKLVGTFTLTAHNPYRVGKNLIESGVVSIQAPSVPLRRITVTFGESLSNPEVRLYDGKYWSGFRVNASVTKGSTLVINIDEEIGKVTFGGNVPSNAITLGDLPQSTVVFSGAKGEVSNSDSSRVMLTWRDVRL